MLTLAFVLFGMGLNGLVTSLGGLFAVDIAPKKVAGAAMGVVGVFSYLGAAMQENISGSLIESGMQVVDGVRIYDFGPAIAFWIGSSVGVDAARRDALESEASRMSRYDFVTVGNYTKDTIVSAAGTRYVDGGGYSYAAHAARLAGLKVAAVTRRAAEDAHIAKAAHRRGHRRLRVRLAEFDADAARVSDRERRRTHPLGEGRRRPDRVPSISRASRRTPS